MSERAGTAFVSAVIGFMLGVEVTFGFFWRYM